MMTDFQTLKEVPGDKAFVFCNGSRAASIYQLVETIEHSNDSVFRHHADEGHNDFAQWARDVLGDESLFRLLQHEDNQYWFCQKVRGHIKFLENMG